MNWEYLYSIAYRPGIIQFLFLTRVHFKACLYHIAEDNILTTLKSVTTPLDYSSTLMICFM